jgi:hypothetical protein
VGIYCKKQQLRHSQEILYQLGVLIVTKQLDQQCLQEYTMGQFLQFMELLSLWNQQSIALTKAFF